MSVARERSPRVAAPGRTRNGVRFSGVLVAIGGAGLLAWALQADAHWAERHVLASYCATFPVEQLLARAAPWAVAALGVLGLGALAALLARWATRGFLPVRPGTVVGAVLAVAASLWVTELHMRRLYQRLALGASPAADARVTAMARPDPRLGWTHVPARTTWVGVGGRRVAYAIDADGDRAASVDWRPDHDRPTVLFTGESIAFGYGLAHEETVPFLVGRALAVQAVNLAVVGYGNDQAHLRVLDALPRYRRPVAVVTLFVPDQIRRNVDIWRPRLALSPDGTLRPVPPSTGPRIAKLLQALPVHGDEALHVTAAILRATAEAARSRGALPLFVVTNYGRGCQGDEGGDPWITSELFTRQGLPFVRVDLDPDDRLPGVFERHPNARGSEKLAAAVERALRNARAPARRDGGTPPDRPAAVPAPTGR